MTLRLADIAVGARRRIPRVRPTAAPARRRSEQRHRQPSGGAQAAIPSSWLNVHLHRAPRAADLRSRSDPDRARDPRSRRSSAASSSGSLQQPQLLVSAVDRHRLRHRDACALRCPPTSTSSRAADLGPLQGRALPSRASAGARPTCSKRAEPVRYLAMIISRFNRLDTASRGRGRGRRHAADSGNAAAGGRVRDMADAPAAVFAVLRRAGRRRAVPELHARGGGERSAGRPQPAVLRAPQSAAAGTPFVWRNDPVSFEQLSGVLPRPRGRAPVVGTGGRLEELPRAVAQRRLRAVLRGAVRREGSRRRRVRRTVHPPDAPDGDRRLRPGPGLSRLPARPHPGRRAGSSARWSTTRAAMVLHMLRRLIGDDAFFAGIRAFYTEWKFKKAGTDDFQHAMETASGRNLQRFFDTLDLRHRHSSREVQLSRIGRRGGCALRSARGSVLTCRSR